MSQRIAQLANELFRFWDSCASQRSRFHPADAPSLASGSHRLPVGRAPEPFFGRPDLARVFFLTFNPHHPGTGSGDSRWEDFCYRMMVGDATLDSFTAAAPSGARDWLKKNVGGFADRSFDGIANLRLFAYPSGDKSALGEVRTVIRALPSARLMKSLVHDLLVPSAKDEEICLLVMRSSDEWGFGKHTNDFQQGGLFVSRPLRTASVTPNSRVGPLVEQYLYGGAGI